ncbi:hypothetical protein IAR50_002828 [Cryptococcus sp. DSM 104548]
MHRAEGQKVLDDLVAAERSEEFERGRGGWDEEAKFNLKYLLATGVILESLVGIIQCHSQRYYYCAACRCWPAPGLKGFDRRHGDYGSYLSSLVNHMVSDSHKRSVFAFRSNQQKLFYEAQMALQESQRMGKRSGSASGVNERLHIYGCNAPTAQPIAGNYHATPPTTGNSLTAHLTHPMTGNIVTSQLNYFPKTQPQSSHNLPPHVLTAQSRMYHPGTSAIESTEKQRSNSRETMDALLCATNNSSALQAQTLPSQRKMATIQYLPPSPSRTTVSPAVSQAGRTAYFTSQRQLLTPAPETSPTAQRPTLHSSSDPVRIPAEHTAPRPASCPPVVKVPPKEKEEVTLRKSTGARLKEIERLSDEMMKGFELLVKEG